jgi:hypothetical protein
MLPNIGKISDGFNNVNINISNSNYFFNDVPPQAAGTGTRSPSKNQPEGGAQSTVRKKFGALGQPSGRKEAEMMLEWLAIMLQKLEIDLQGVDSIEQQLAQKRIVYTAAF